MPKLRFSFQVPKRKTVALIDSSGLGLLSNYIQQTHIAIVDVAKINFWVALRMVVSGKKSLPAYIFSYLQIVKPKFVFTFIDNDVNFYTLSSKFPNIKFIAVQNGNRANYANQPGNGFFDLLRKSAATDKLSAHTVCVLGKTSADQYSEYIDSNFLVTGSLKNNFIGSNIEQTKNYDIVYISQHAPYDIVKSQSKFYFGQYDVSAQQFYQIEAKVVRFLAERCARTGETFAVLGKRTESDEFEKNFFINSAVPHSIDFIPRTSDYSTYEFCNSASLVVTIDSTTGYEFLSRRKKVAFFSGRIHAADQTLALKVFDTDFGFPLKLEKTGPFWTNFADETEFERIINTVQGLSQTEWASIISPYTDVVMAYQPGNTAFIHMLEQEGIPVRSEVLHRA